MSLFANVFAQQPAAPTTNLFSSSSKFIATSAAEDTAPSTSQVSPKKPAPIKSSEKQNKQEAKLSKKRKAETQPDESIADVTAEEQVKSNKPSTSKAPAATGTKGSKAKQDEKAKKSKKAKKPPAVDSDGDIADAPAEVEADGEASGDEVEGEKETPEENTKLSPEEQEAKLRRTCFVGNLPVKMKRKTIKHLFSQFGTVESVRMRSVPVKTDAKMPRRSAILSGKVVDDALAAASAYVVFTTEEAVTAAMAANMSEVDGHHIRVDRAAPPSKKTGASKESNLFEPLRSVFVGNLHFNIQDEELIRVFNSSDKAEELENAVEAVRVIRDKDINVGKGFGYVLFKTQAAAKAALRLNGTEIRSRALRVTRVNTNAKSTQNWDGSDAPRKGPGGRGMRMDVPEERWQGAKTSGKAKALHGAKGQRPLDLKTKGRSANPDRKEKRPAVAARKALQLAMKEGAQKKKPWLARQGGAKGGQGGKRPTK